MKLANICLPALLLVTFSGCVTTKDCLDRCMADCRNRCYAEMAWLRCKSNFGDVDCKCDFGKGFRDGYVNVAAGGSTCQPALPPREYWHFEHQNPQGQARQLAWFNGFSYGAVYAEQEGIADWSRVVTAPTLPPYRKRRPTRAAAAGASAGAGAENVQPYNVQPYIDEGIAPPVEPVPMDDPGMPPSAAADIENLEDSHAGVARDAGQAGGAPVRWTDSADGY